MKLPNVEAVVVSDDKIAGYLLSPTHRDGRHKAAFFLGFGFTGDAGQTPAATLLKHAADHEIAKVESTPFGTRYVVECTIEAPVWTNAEHSFGVVSANRSGRTTFCHSRSTRRS
jgi:hypothetical protein